VFALVQLTATYCIDTINVYMRYCSLTGGSWPWRWRTKRPVMTIDIGGHVMYKFWVLGVQSFPVLMGSKW